MEMDCGPKWHRVVHQDFNIFALLDPQRRTRDLTIRGNGFPRKPGDFLILPCEIEFKLNYLA